MKRHHVSVLVKLIIIKKHDVLMNIEAFALTVLLTGNTATLYGFLRVKIKSTFITNGKKNFMS